MCNFVTYLKFRVDDVCLKYLPALTFCFVLLGRFNDIGIQVYSQLVTMYVTCYSNSHPQYELTWTLGRSLVWICYSSSRLQDNKKKENQWMLALCSLILSVLVFKIFTFISCQVSLTMAGIFWFIIKCASFFDCRNFCLWKLEDTFIVLYPVFINIRYTAPLCIA